MANYRELALKDESAVSFDWDNPPEQPAGGFAPAIYPDSYEFELPKDLENCWEVVEINEGDLKGQYVALQFDAQHPLVGIRSQSGQHDGETYNGRISGVPRNRSKKGDPPKYASDLMYLLLYGFEGKEKPKNSREWISVVNGYAGKHFVADAEWSAFCNKKKTIYVYDAQGNAVEDPGVVNPETGVTSKRVGCGKNYYMRDIPKDAQGAYSERFQCSCGAALRAFPQLVRFRLVAGEAAK